MIEVTVKRKVCNAADRTKDRNYAKTIKLPAVPDASACVVGRHCYYVRSLKFQEDSTSIRVTLDPDNSNFKGEPFTRLCKTMESDGFTTINDADEQERKQP